MRTYATTQRTGDRSLQCDATAVRTAPDGARAFVLLDGIGSSYEVREWTRAAAVRLARAAARRGDAEAGLRAVYDAYAEERGNHSWIAWGMPKAAAVVAVTAPGRPLTVAWCGDPRAYLRRRGELHRLTEDHNLRRVYPPGNGMLGGSRNVLTSCLGDARDDEQVKAESGHPAIECVTWPAGPGRLLLASDGAYEPIEDAGKGLARYLGGPPSLAAATVVNVALNLSQDQADEYGNTHADNATALVADLT